MIMPYLDPNAIIAETKLTQYLLVFLSKDDKSQYLALGGYTLDNWQELERDLRNQILTLEATLTTKTKYGQKYEIIAELTAPNGRILPIKTISMVTDRETKFVTLFPS